VASVAYHDLFWYPRYGQQHLTSVIGSPWGRLFANWGTVSTDPEGRGYPDVGQEHPGVIRTGLKHFMEGARLVGMAVAESPEVQARQRRKQAEARGQTQG
jgi:hypothetical protein